MLIPKLVNRTTMFIGITYLIIKMLKMFFMLILYRYNINAQ